jgi:hypothetical protein
MKVFNSAELGASKDALSQVVTISLLAVRGRRLHR